MKSVDKNIAEVENSLVVDCAPCAEEMFEAFEVDSLREVDERLKKVARRTTVREELSNCETKLVESMKARSLRRGSIGSREHRLGQTRTRNRRDQGSTQGRVRTHKRTLSGAWPRRGCDQCGGR